MVGVRMRVDAHQARRREVELVRQHGVHADRDGEVGEPALRTGGAVDLEQRGDRRAGSADAFAYGNEQVADIVAGGDASERRYMRVVLGRTSWPRSTVQLSTFARSDMCSRVGSDTTGYWSSSSRIGVGSG
jgi:hypothetical protein